MQAKRAALALGDSLPKAHKIVSGTLLFIGLGGCAAVPVNFETIASQLEQRSAPYLTEHPETFRAILQDALAKDAYQCDPLPDQVFFGWAPPGYRTIHGTMPHYGLYYGPMHYQIVRKRYSWEVRLRVAVEPPSEDKTLELADCTLRGKLQGEMQCEGTPYELSNSLDACPKSGIFRAKASLYNVKKLLEDWSSRVEEDYNRDALYFDLPIHYDFEFFLVEPSGKSPKVEDIRLPLDPGCARTPYFWALHSGWSRPIVAHEMGHVLGLIDEYETFSGIVGFYPKTPFAGAEKSRMGLSMRPGTRFLPLHHYLILRRYFCEEPESRDPYYWGVQ